MLDAVLPETLEETVSEFELLGLPRPLVSGLARQGIETPFPIQSATIPDVLAGHDVLGRGQTGSGKTLAFGLPTMARIAGTRPAPGRPRAMILVPTRELALQVHDALEPLGRGLGLRMKVVVGGMSMGKQIEALRRGVDVVVATPGRLGDLIRQGECSLADIEVSVLDEADHMCDLGFFPVVCDLLAQTPAGGQRLLFSATLDGDVDKLVQRFLKDPVTHSVAPATSPVDTMEHHLLQVTREEKFDVAAEIANREGRTIIFVRTQHGVDRLCKQLARVGVRAGGLHGGKRQNQRTRILSEFREGEINVLVCTDVAARGIHVDNISLVLHVDPPQDHKSYLHRGGRTARAGEKGTVVTLVLPNERRSTDALTRRAGIHPFKLKAAPGHPRVAEVTGARTPSGESIPVWEPDVRKPLRGRGEGDSDRGPRRGRRPGFDGRRREGAARPYGERSHGGSRHEGDRPFGGDRQERVRSFDGSRQEGDRPFEARHREGGERFSRAREGGDHVGRAHEGDRFRRRHDGDRPWSGRAEDGRGSRDRDNSSGRDNAWEPRAFGEGRAPRGRAYGDDRGNGGRSDDRRRFSREDRPWNGHRGGEDRSPGGHRGADERPWGGRRGDDRPWNGRRGEDRSWNGHRGDDRWGGRRSDGERPRGDHRAGYRPDPRGEDRPRGGYRSDRGRPFSAEGRPFSAEGRRFDRAVRDGERSPRTER
ncbi:DEAD/DEAH box helicase [Thermoactinospora rubra]|uniref:DEAD/DEAH box helicase n=1 Tax=Thermoactinospora rubra TaxID=1088767 RepID=UPI000A1163C5|nr:DEAD/DEAH box helicase [Thermoactinospora rubra]